MVGSLMGDYDTKITNKPLLNNEGVVVVSITNRYNDTDVTPHLLVRKSTECVGFMTFAESNIVDGERHLNVLKVPAGTYQNNNWGLFFNGPPSWGKYIYPIDTYDLTFTIEPGEVLYLGNLIATNNSLLVVDAMETDLALAFQAYPKLKNKKLTKKLAVINTIKTLEHCR